MEDIILLEVKMAHPYYEVFKLEFTVGEFVIFVFNPQIMS